VPVALVNVRALKAEVPETERDVMVVVANVLVPETASVPLLVSDDVAVIDPVVSDPAVKFEMVPVVALRIEVKRLVDVALVMVVPWRDVVPEMVRAVAVVVARVVVPVTASVPPIVSFPPIELLPDVVRLLMVVVERYVFPETVRAVVEALARDV
jgi:hypothetical protein